MQPGERVYNLHSVNWNILVDVHEFQGCQLLSRAS